MSGCPGPLFAPGVFDPGGVAELAGCYRGLDGQTARGIFTMYTHHSTLYPMLGVGIFFVGFWTGFVLAYEAGLPCIALPLTGLLTGVGGVRFVIGLERLGRGDYRRPRPKAEPSRTGSVTAARLVTPILKPR